MPRVAVYTCVTGGYDRIKPVSVRTEGVDYICFSDSAEGVPSSWQWRRAPSSSMGPKDVNRFVKMHPHSLLPDYDLTIYIDGSIEVVGDLGPLLQAASSSNALVFAYEHFERDCIFQEAAVCAHHSYDWIWTIARQMRRYRSEGFAENQGLFEAGVLIRKRVAKVDDLMNEWWDEYRRGAKRDQLSLPVVAWRHRVELTSLGKSDPRFIHRYFVFHDHPARRRVSVTVRRYVNRLLATLFTYERLFSVPALKLHRTR